MKLTGVIILTERLKLVPINEDYIKNIYDNFTNDITTYMYPQPATNIKDTEEFVKNSMKGLMDGSNLQLVILDNNSGEFLGCCGLHKVLNNEPELGIWLKKNAHNKGLGIEAITGIINWAKKNLQFEYLKYPVDRKNYPSRRIPESHNGIVMKEYIHKNMAGNDLDIIEYWIK